ncbi:TPA: phage tail protein [Streptococcus suis]
MQAGYRVFYYERYDDLHPKVLHEPYTFGEKLSSGTLTQSINENDTFEFSIGMDHKYYNLIQPIVGLVKIINLVDDEIEFFGRVLTSLGEMSDTTGFSRVFTCESVLGYLHDSTQTFKKMPNTGVEMYFREIIETHNTQVEPHKRFKIGSVTVDTGSDVPNRYLGYESTFETVRTQLLGRMGGYIQLRIEPDGNYIDYLAEIGEKIISPIQLGQNIKSARRELNLDGLITRLVPVGGDLDQGSSRDDETGQYVIRERVTIDSVNGGVGYLEDAELVNQFGIIQSKVDWNDINDPNVLLARGRQYMENQRVALASWDLDTVELYLIDQRYKKFVKGNIHPVINPPLSGLEELQIISKTVDILFPQQAKLAIGSVGQNLTTFLLQQQEAKKSIEKVLADQAKVQRQFELKNQITLLTAEITKSETRLAKIGVDILELENTLKTMDPENDGELINSTRERIETLKQDKVAVEQLIDDMNKQLDELKKGVES